MRIENAMYSRYMQALVGRLFKILPLWEDGEETLGEYMQSLQLELVGLRDFDKEIGEDELFLSIIAVLQYLIDHPTCEVRVVKREIFRSIRICNVLYDRYLTEVVP